MTIEPGWDTRCGRCRFQDKELAAICMVRKPAEFDRRRVCIIFRRFHGIERDKSGECEHWKHLQDTGTQAGEKDRQEAQLMDDRIG